MDKPIPGPRVPKMLLGIIGHPLHHSLSPLLHNTMLAEQGIQAAYHTWPMLEDRLEDFVNAMRTLPIHGVSVTIPHKEAIMDLIDNVSELAAEVGAVNTVLWRNGRLYGANTDVFGFMAPLENLQAVPSSALVMGAGGASRAAIVGLKQLQVKDILISARNLAKSQALAQEMGCTAVPWEERASQNTAILINTTPLGTTGKLQDLSPWPEKTFPRRCIAYDLVYNPQETTFLRQAREAGCHTISGLEMLLHQGVRQFYLWTGKNMSVRGGRKLLTEALQQHPEPIVMEPED